MGFAEVLTIIFIVLKLVEVIDWSWLACFAPMIIVYGIIALVFLAIAFFAIVTGTYKERKSRTWRDM